jgi:hypothetical protein
MPTTMTWSGYDAESTYRRTRLTRPTYVPPHLRNNGVYVPNESNQPGLQTSASRGQGHGHGRGGGRGWFNQTEHWSPSPNQSSAPFDISSKFDELEVDHDDETNTGSGSINFEAYEDIQLVVLALYDALSTCDVATVHQIVATDLEWWFHGPPSHQFFMRLLTGSATASASSFTIIPQPITSFGPTVLAEERVPGAHV